MELSKPVLRQRFRARRATITPAQRESGSAALCERLLHCLKVSPSGVVAVYLASRTEPDLSDLIAALLRQGVAVVAPRRDDFCRLSRLDSLELDERGIAMPDGDPVDPAGISVFLVPGLAFTAAGARLGQGGGWYDRALSRKRSDAITIGIAFDEQITDELPLEEHDVPVLHVATPTAWLDCSRAERDSGSDGLAQEQDERPRPAACVLKGTSVPDMAAPADAEAGDVDADDADADDAAPGADPADAALARADARSPVAPPAILLPAPLVWVVTKVPALRWPVRFGWRLGERWGNDQCAIIAAALAFFGLLSIFPIVLAAVAILSRALVNHPEALEAFHSFVQGFFPGAAGDITRQIDAVARATEPATLGVLAVASLLWSGRAYFATLASVLDQIWPHASPRPFLQNQIALWSLFLGAGMLWLLSTLATFALRTVQALAQASPELFINRSPAVWDVAGKLLSFALTTLMFWLLYRFLPNVATRRRRRLVWGAAIIGSIGWEVSKWLYTTVIGANVGRYEATYGSVAGVVLTLLWIYLSSSILLLGAEAAAVYEELRAGGTRVRALETRMGEA